MCNRERNRAMKKTSSPKFKQGQIVAVKDSELTFSVEVLVVKDGKYYYENSEGKRFAETLLTKATRKEQFYLYVDVLAGEIYGELLTINKFNLWGNSPNNPDKLMKLEIPPVTISVEWENKPEEVYPVEDEEDGEEEEEEEEEDFN